VNFFFRKISINPTLTQTWQAHLVWRFSMMALCGIILTKLNFNRAFIGQFEALLLLANLLSSSWINGSFQTLLGLKGNIQKNIQSAFTFLALITSCLALGVFIFPIPFLNLLNLPLYFDNFKTNHWLALWLLTYPLSSLMEFSWMIKGKKNQIWISTFFLQTPIPIVVGTSAVIFNNPIAPIAALSLWGALRLGIFIATNPFLFIPPKFAFRFLKLSLPLTFAAALSNSAPMIDGIIVRQLFSDEDFAIFIYGAREFPLFILMATALSETLVLHLKMNGELNMLKNKSIKLMGFIIPIAFGLLLSSHFLFQFFFNSDFIKAAKIFDIYLLLVIPRMLFPQVILLANQKRKQILGISVIEFIANISLSLILAPIWGLEGIAWATFIAFSIDKVLLIFYNIFTGIKVKNWLPLKQWLLFSVSLSLAFIFKYFVL